MTKRTGIYVRVSTDDQRDNGYSIDSQLRMIKEYCEKNNYDIVDIYNDAGHSGKDLIRPQMKRLIDDIKSKKLDKLVAIKVDRLTRNNYDGFWLLNYCEQYDVKIELVLEPYDVSTANGEMIFGMNLVFGQRERKEISARTKRAMEEMALEHIHPAIAPFGYIRTEKGTLEIEPIESLVVKEIFELCKKGLSTRGISTIMKEKNAYLRNAKWRSDKVYKILTNKIYIGIYEYGKTRRKKEDILKVENYCEPIIDINTWNITRTVLEKNKHPNYGEHIHLFSSIVLCPECGKIMSSSLSYKHTKTTRKAYYHLTCKNINCKAKGYHYSSDKIEQKLGRILDELTRYMYDKQNEIIILNINTTKEIKDIDKAIEKLKIQEKKLVDLYLNSNLNVEAINKKNENIKKEIEQLKLKKEQLDPNQNQKEYAIELLKKLEYKKDNEYIYSNLAFSFKFDSLNKKTKRELINRLIDKLEITRDENYNIEIKNIKFTEEFISKSNKEYLEYLNEILNNNNMGVIYKEIVDKNKLKELSNKYRVISMVKPTIEEYKETLNKYQEQLKEHFYNGGVIICPYVENNNITDYLLLIPERNI